MYRSHKKQTVIFLYFITPKKTRLALFFIITHQVHWQDPNQSDFTEEQKCYNQEKGNKIKEKTASTKKKSCRHTDRHVTSLTKTKECIQ